MNCVFGPVPSRRLGRSLGIDLIPLKTCTYDCVYCQLGKTDVKTIVRRHYVPIDEVMEELSAALENTPGLDYITFSGSGEPTLHAGLGEIIQKIKGLTSVPVAVITNSSLLYKPEVREALNLADLVMPSLDAVSEPVFREINRPHPELKLHNILEGLERFIKSYKGHLWLEVLFVKGLNDSEEELKRMAYTINTLQVETVHANTVVRPPAEPDIFPVEVGAEDIVSQLGDKACLIGKFQGVDVSQDVENPWKMQDQILVALQRRPSTIGDLSSALGYHPQEILKVIDRLIQDHRLEPSYYDGAVYYIVKSGHPPT